ncbi:MAG: ATP-binding protein [Thermoanaerobaculales bacterium]|jgi:two-component system NtrC family sensor kinase|nr:ATP-binding protein [Thermoanaerobaculales bacterium]
MIDHEPQPQPTSGAYESLRRRILASMILAPALPFAVVLLVGTVNFNLAIREATVSRMVRIAEDHRNAVQAFLDERHADLEFVAHLWTFEGLRRERTLADVLADLRRQAPAFVDLGVFDADGVLVAYEGPYDLTGKVYSDAEWFRRVVERGTFVSDVFLGYRNSPHFVIAIARGEGAGRWVLRATIDPQLFTQMVESVHTGRTGEAYVLNREGVFQTARRSGGTLLEVAPERVGLDQASRAVATTVARDAGGERFVWATAWLNDDQWLLVVRQEVGDAFWPVRRATYLGIVILVIGGSAIVLLAVSMTDGLIRRLQRLDEEKRRLNQQLIVAGRLAEIGEMSAGFAHEINNPLQIIRSEHALIAAILDDLFARGDLTRSDDTAELLDSVRQIRTQVDRCAAVTQGILKFARQTEPTPRELALSEFIPEVAAMVASKAAVSGIALDIAAPADLPPVVADRAQLQQVVLNLVNNAFDAVEQRHGTVGGRVGITAVKNGDRIEIAVQDNGTGISANDLEKVFTPFFSTKPVGKGTGLGLSICFGIVDSMGGSIRVASEERVGTTFTVSLPAAVSQEDERRKTP